MLGQQVPVIPGWDCHGLPIELKVTQENPGLKGPHSKKPAVHMRKNGLIFSVKNLSSWVY